MMSSVQQLGKSENRHRGAKFNHADILKRIERSLPHLSLIFLVAGIAVTKVFPAIGVAVDTAFSTVIGLYVYLAPVAIFAILTPSLTKIFQTCTGGRRKFVLQMFLWFARSRIMACLWGAIFTALVFGLPLYTNHTANFATASVRGLKSLGWMLMHSTYLYAIYASLVAVAISLKMNKPPRWIEAWAQSVETFGQHLVPFVPVSMFAIGSYVCYLPTRLEGQIAADAGIRSLGSFTVFGFVVYANSATGMFLAYCIGAGLTGLACFVWHFGLILVARHRVPAFSIRTYFRGYWCRVYPLLFATSSEALATPLNLHLVKKCYPGMLDQIRRFVIGGGSFLGINGTIICVFVLAGLVANLVGAEISLLHLLLSVPLVFVMGYAVPGIPGELLLFGGPMVIVLGIDERTAPLFLALYVSLQLGLPDSFRTGANSTDNCVIGVIVQDMYDRRFNGVTAVPVAQTTGAAAFVSPGSGGRSRQ